MGWRAPTRRRRVLRIAAVVALILGVAAFLTGRSRVAWDQACTLARRELPQLLGAEVGLGRCEVDPTQRTVRVYGISAGPASEARPSFSADALEVTVSGIQPISGRLELER